MVNLTRLCDKSCKISYSMCPILTRSCKNMEHLGSDNLVLILSYVRSWLRYSCWVMVLTTTTTTTTTMTDGQNDCFTPCCACARGVTMVMAEKRGGGATCSVSATELVSSPPHPSAREKDLVIIATLLAIMCMC